MGETTMKNSPTRSGLAAVVVAIVIVLGGASPASAITQNLGSHSCNGAGIFTNSRTTFGTSHNVWVSSSNNQGTSWTGNAVYRIRSFVSTMQSANATYITATNIDWAQKGCYY
ncbi:hypothetical protein [Microcella sp.]|uniref:hypothetical protein n=1 Tax=Microcella sp. TaxID=1913979 RepID=UPI00299F58D0|nr:hypothetical protein [Microcella sp.]MDX2026499.1 hypothetical protein [Microcella sp.]